MPVTAVAEASSNRLLAALPAAEFERLRPDLKWITMPLAR